MNFIKSLYLTNRLFIAIAIVVLLFVISFFIPVIFGIVQLIFFGLMALLLLDIVLLFFIPNAIFARREMAEKLSNGDYNDIFIYIENRYSFKINCEVIDEIPHQFQKRDVLFFAEVNSGEAKIIRYQLRPVKRGEYSFGALNIYVMTMLGLAKKRYRFSQDVAVPVYPSFLQLRQYQLMAISNRLTDLGIKKIRRIGHSMEFEQIREYVAGDDYRTMNWKATARSNQLMVNAFQDEKAQQVYCLIDKGRVMKMPFEGMSLLDYAINATLVISNIALMKHDKAGLITFSNTISNVLPAEKRSTQMNKILEVLYNQRTQYLESDYELVYTTVRTKINQRSLLLLFTNFETLNSMNRNLKFLKQLANKHLLLVVLFENTELKEMLDKRASSSEEIYMKTIAEKFRYEKKLIAKELSHFGIHSIVTTPKNLTANTINKYLEFKSRGLI